MVAPGSADRLTFWGWLNVPGAGVAVGGSGTIRSMGMVRVEPVSTPPAVVYAPVTVNGPSRTAPVGLASGKLAAMVAARRVAVQVWGPAAGTGVTAGRTTERPLPSVTVSATELASDERPDSATSPVVAALILAGVAVVTP